MTRRRRPVQRAVATAIGAASLCAACGLTDASCWAPFADDEALCERMQALAEKARTDCDASIPEPVPSDQCAEFVGCLVDERRSCLAEWQTLWDCANTDKRTCSERSADGGFSGFCSNELDKFYDCALGDSGYANRNELLRDCLGSCGNNVCDTDIGEDSHNCPNDCLSPCSEDGGCQDAS